ncbi:MAG: hypothetical protein KatS3mg070_0209 [Meiothermus sp.]|nr:MAG: hypothetical protein KatS3mg070_0209 [Meiothermus sp.]
MIRTPVSPSRWLHYLIALLAFPLPWLVSLWLPGWPVAEVGFSLAFSLAAGALLGIALHIKQRGFWGPKSAAIVFAILFGWWATATILNFSSQVLRQNVLLLALILVGVGLVLMFFYRSLNKARNHPS